MGRHLPGIITQGPKPARPEVPEWPPTSSSARASGRAHAGLSTGTLAGGGFVAAWSGSNGLLGNQSGVFYKLFDANGAAKTGILRAEVTVAGNQLARAALATPDGGFVVARDSVCPDSRNASSITNSDVFARKFDAAGNAVTREVEVTVPSAENDQYCQDMQVAADGGTRFVTVASFVRTDWTVNSHLFDASLGAPRDAVLTTDVPTGFAAAFRTLTPGYQLVARADGTVLATWWHEPTDASGNRIGASDLPRRWCSMAR